jgi:hypothetical protein
VGIDLFWDKFLCDDWHTHVDVFEAEIKAWVSAGCITLDPLVGLHDLFYFVVDEVVVGIDVLFYQST